MQTDPRVIDFMNSYLFPALLWSATFIGQPESADKHWAFQPVKRIEPPAGSAGCSANPIDRFVRARQL